MILNTRALPFGIILLCVVGLIGGLVGCYSLPSSSTTHTQLPAATLTVTATSTPAPTPTTTATPTATPIPRWDEYESALVEAAFPGLRSGICEWDLLGQQKQEVYVWALCGDDTPNTMSMSAPAVVYLDADGSILRAQFPSVGDYVGLIKVLFPPKIQAEIWAYRLDPDTIARFNLRAEDPNIPPLIVVSGTPLP